ncbi:MAG TPA: hypothetical protein EYP07_05420, partial [Kiloniellaceae bacterium]|nr:hypothetical protein [Kiloniellaceae bacterium]
MTPRTGLTAAVLAVLFALAWLVPLPGLGDPAGPGDPVDLAPDRDLVDRYGPDLVAYATVRRSDGTYRRMLTQPETLTAVAAEGVPPDGARILMETYYRPGQVSTVFHMEKVAGRWAYGSFSASTSNPNLATRPQASCLSCHAGAAETDLVYTLPSLRAF